MTLEWRESEKTHTGSVHSCSTRYLLQLDWIVVATTTYCGPPPLLVCGVRAATNKKRNKLATVSVASYIVISLERVIFLLIVCIMHTSALVTPTVYIVQRLCVSEHVEWLWTGRVSMCLCLYVCEYANECEWLCMNVSVWFKLFYTLFHVNFICTILYFIICPVFYYSSCSLSLFRCCYRQFFRMTT